MADERDGPDTLRVPFIFVKHGDPEPKEWMARHPGWVKFPAVMIPRNSPHHPANGGRYPSFDAPPRPPVESVPESEAWPLGKPISATLRGTMSRLHPGGRPPPYPGGHGAPPGTPGTGDPIGAFLRVNDALDPRKLRHIAGPSAPPPPPSPTLATARESAFLALLR